VGCSSGFSDRGISGSLRPRLSGIVACLGDSCRFPKVGGGCDFCHNGPSLRVNSSCFSSKGVTR